MNCRKREINERMKQRQVRRAVDLMAAFSDINSPVFQDTMRRGMEAMVISVQEVVRRVGEIKRLVAEKAAEDVALRRALSGYDQDGRR